MKPIYLGLRQGQFRSVSMTEEGAKRDCDQVVKLMVYELEMIVGLFMSQDKGIKLYKAKHKNTWSDYTFENKSNHE